VAPRQPLDGEIAVVQNVNIEVNISSKNRIDFSKMITRTNNSACNNLLSDYNLILSTENSLIPL